MIGGLNARIGTISKHAFWPSEFEKVCHKGKCKRINSSSSYLDFNIEFSVEEVPEDFNSGNYKIKDIKIERKSKLLKNYIKINQEFPYENCSR